MRHALAGSAQGGDDHSRALTDLGRSDARRMGQRLRELDAVPNRAICSSALRCRETFEGVYLGLTSTSSAGDARMPPTVDIQDRLYNASPETLINAIDEVLSVQSLLVIAHNPGVSMLALELARGSDEDEARLRGGFTPATLAIYEIAAEAKALTPRAAKLSHVESPI